jgi:hypothetical protein
LIALDLGLLKCRVDDGQDAFEVGTGCDFWDDAIEFTVESLLGCDGFT